MTLPAEGGDLSNNNNAAGPIDFAALYQAGWRFAFNKASEGNNWPDPDFLHNVKGELANGIEPDAYHFARFDLHNDAEDEARFFLSRLPACIQRIALDVETGSGDLSGPVLAFLQYCERHAWSPDRIYLYTSRDFIANHGLGHPALARYKLWLADPGGPHLGPIGRWPRPDVDQWNWHGRVRGVVGDVDLDRMVS